ncbi:TonB-dependent receptor [Bacteroides sp. OttesenSCG-928-D19]|nr:TonB-dependent receptor [Bacteroides sp. OttesenSCG-928-D19]
MVQRMARRSIKAFLFCLVAFSALLAHAQNGEERMNIDIKDASLEEFIKSIESLTGYSFIYGEEVRISHPVTVYARRKTLEEILNQAFVRQPISFQISGKHILLRKTDIKPKPASHKYTISGYITDGQSSETLIGANVYETYRGQGTSTNPYGFFTITLPGGEVKLHASYLGYTSQIRQFALNKDTLLNIRMESNNVLDEVLILSDRVESGIMATHTGAVDIPITQINNTPTILGEADVMKTIQLIPGVQTGVEGSAGLYVRGGGPDQNLVLLDDVPIYNVDHLLGFFSIFTPEAIKKVTLFKGSFPARFGGRLSSVVDVRTNDGDMKSYHGSLSLGLLSSKLHFEGPIIKERTAFNIALRRTYLDWISKPFMSKDYETSYYFYDINAKVNHKFSDKNRLFLSYYQGNDYLRYSSFEEWEGETSEDTRAVVDDKVSMRWGNTIMAARWNYIVNSKIFSNTTVAFNQYKLNMDARSYYRYNSLGDSYHTNYNSGIRDWSARVDFDYTPTPKHHIKFGGNYLYHNFSPEVMTTQTSSITGAGVQDTTYHGISNSRIYAHEVAVYAEDNFDITPRLRANIGWHFSAFHVENKTYFSLQPRLAMRYQLADDVVVKASYSKMNQYINLLTSAPISMPTDLWVPVTRKVKPMLSHQFSLGTYYNGIKGWEFSVEGYYKNMRNILEYKDATRFIGSSSSWEDKVEMGNGRSFGVEFMAQRTVGNTTGWLAYTLAKSDRKFAKGGINNGERFPYKYDRRHTIDLMLNHTFNSKVDIGATWTFASGAATTIAQEVSAVIRPDGGMMEQDYIESRNNYRLPPCHRLNVGINLHKKTKNGMRTWNFSIYNMYNAMNPTFVHRSVKPDPNKEGEFIPVINKLTLLPLVPSVTYTYKF